MKNLFNFCIFFCFFQLSLFSSSFLNAEALESISDANRVNVMTFNLRVYDAGGDSGKKNWTNRRLHVENIIHGKIDECLGDLAALDFLGVQEANWPELTVFGEKITSHQQTGVKGKAGIINFGESVKLFYQTERWTLDDQGVIKIGSDQWGQRIMGWAHFKDKLVSGRGIYVLNSHWPVHGNISGDKITAWISNRKEQKDPVVVMGDFNNAASTFPFFEKASQNVHLASVFDQLLDKVIVKDLKALGTCHHFTNNWKTNRIDHIFISSPVMSGIQHPLTCDFSEIIHYPSQHSGQCDAFASDHFPVFAQLRFE